MRTRGHMAILPSHQAQNMPIMHDVLKQYRGFMACTPSEMRGIFYNLARSANLDPDTMTDRQVGVIQPRLKRLHENGGYYNKPLDAVTFKEARLFLGLDYIPMAQMLGFKVNSNTRTAMKRIEDDARPVSGTVSVIMRAFLSGYRPGNWPMELD